MLPLIAAALAVKKWQDDKEKAEGERRQAKIAPLLSNARSLGANSYMADAKAAEGRIQDPSSMDLVTGVASAYSGGGSGAGGAGSGFNNVSQLVDFMAKRNAEGSDGGQANPQPSYGGTSFDQPEMQQRPLYPEQYDEELDPNGGGRQGF
jgi:hypothetical protein